MSSAGPTTLAVAGSSVVATVLSSTSGSSGGASHTSTSPGTTSLSVSHVPTTLPVSASLPPATTSAEPEGVPLVHVGGSAAGSSTSATPLG